MTNKQSILLVGAGPMAIEYAKVLKTLKKNFLVASRGVENAKKFEEATKSKVISGGVEEFLKSRSSYPKHAIVAVSEEQLGKVTLLLLQHGIKSILVEKPAGLDFADVRKVYKVSKELKAEVFVGYNRRFYASIKKALGIIKKDGGISSIYFDFTEASFRIAPLIKAQGVKENWFLQNSTHVIDLAFFLAGLPKKIASFTKGGLNWHPQGAIFTGSGITKKDIPFSYHANWDAPGRWSVEVMTKKSKLIFKPLEKLQIQKSGGFQVEDVKIDNQIDNEIKAGIYWEVKSFLGNKQNLCTITEQVENLKFYKQILEGNS